MGGEIQITDAIAILLEREPVFGVTFSEGRYDIGQEGRLPPRPTSSSGSIDDDLATELEQMLAQLVRARGLA